MHDENYQGFVFYPNEEEAQAALIAVKLKYKGRYAKILHLERIKVTPRREHPDWSLHRICGQSVTTRGLARPPCQMQLAQMGCTVWKTKRSN